MVTLRSGEPPPRLSGEPAARRRRARSSAKRVSCSSRVRCSSCSRRTAGGRNRTAGGQEALRGSIGTGLAAAGGGVTAVNATRIASGLAASCAGELRRNGEDGEFTESDAQMQCGLSPAVWAIALAGGRGGVELDACIATRQELSPR